MNDKVEILLVEDNFSDAEMTIRVLKKNNLVSKLLHLGDGAEALDFIFAEGNFASRKMEVLPKLILLDLKMPKVNGLQVLEKLKSDERTKMIPVVILTSSSEDSDVEECYRLGANSFVVKPLQFDKFSQVITDLANYWMLFNQSPV